MDGSSLDGSVVELAARLGVRDGLVFRRVTHTSWAHLGGFGRGRGWAGVVEVDASCDPLVELVPATPGELTRSATCRPRGCSAPTTASAAPSCA